MLISQTNLILLKLAFNLDKILSPSASCFNRVIVMLVAGGGESHQLLETVGQRANGKFSDETEFH